MSDFKMVENRKYNDEEIKYVVSRVHAGWDPEIIAKAFKRDHGEYWAEREFTKKQVAYIRSTYKPPPNVVKPYTGPIPDFSRSPTPEDSPHPTSTPGRKRKQAFRGAHNRSSSYQTSAYGQASSPIAGPSRKRQKTQALRNTPNLQGGLGEDEDPVRDFIPGAGLFPSLNDEQEEAIPQGLMGVNDNTGDNLSEVNFGFIRFDKDEDPAPENPSPGMSPDQGSYLPNFGMSPAQGPDLPNYLDLLPDFPVQSVERHRSVAPGSGISETNSALQTPQQPQSLPLGGQDLQGRFPSGYSLTGARARDEPYGVWYYGPHDHCQIPLGHRHDFGGGVWFTSVESVTMSLLAMKNTEGIGFMLGVATAASNILNKQGVSHFDAPPYGVDIQNVETQAARVVSEHVPEEVLGRNFGVPRGEDLARLPMINSALPTGSFFDPFHRRAVQYDMPGHSGSQGGEQGDGAPGSSRPSRQGSGQGESVAGPSRQRSGQGESAAGPFHQGSGKGKSVAGPSRQGSGQGESAAGPFGQGIGQGDGAPGPSNQSRAVSRVLRSQRQRNENPQSGETPRQGTGSRPGPWRLRPSRQDDGAPGPSNS